MSQVTTLRIAFLVAVLLTMGFQLWEDDAPKPDPDEPRQYLRPIEQAAPHRVVHFPCPATAAEGGVCTTVTHAHPLGPAPNPNRTYKANCMYVNDQEVGC